MVRQCHLNTCPVGIATQDLDLRAKFAGSVDQVVTLFQHVAQEIRHHLAGLGARSMAQIIGRADLLRPVDQGHPLAADLAALLVRAQDRKRHEGYNAIPTSDLARRVVEDAREAINGGEPVELHYPIRNVDRTVGARLSGEIAALHGDEGLADNTVHIRLSGTAGQSLGAWLAPGIAIHLHGVANDYVGKGMAGGVISISPSRGLSIPHVAGNAVLYGATGGKVYLAGRVGQRFAVRNSGATAVVEGCSDHGCEYMTGGTVVVLGGVGRNFAAGMTGGTAFVWDPAMSLKGRLAETAPRARRPTASEIEVVREMVQNHHEATNSPVAAEMIQAGGFDDFWVIAPGEDSAETTIIVPEQRERAG